MDSSLEQIQGWVWERKKPDWRLFGWQGWWRSEAENHWTCKSLLENHCCWLRQSLSLIFRFSLCNLQNILVVSKYYSRITLRRLAELLCLSIEVIDLVLSGCIMHFLLLKLVIQIVIGCGIISQEAEKYLSEMVVSKALIAKIDRPSGIVCFQIAKDSNEILNSWAVNLEKLLDLVEKSCHQIHKETMVHKAVLRSWTCALHETFQDLRWVYYQLCVEKTRNSCFIDKTFNVVWFCTLVEFFPRGLSAICFFRLSLLKKLIAKEIEKNLVYGF